jgi:hypothetical protein
VVSTARARKTCPSDYEVHKLFLMGGVIMRCMRMCISRLPVSALAVVLTVGCSRLNPAANVAESSKPASTLPLALAAGVDIVVDVGPWRLGTTREQVASFEQYGPYLPVTITGGLETPNGIFQGTRTKVSFVFDRSGLLTIQVWRYEGRDVDAAKVAVLELFDLFTTTFGGAYVENISGSDPKGLGRDALGAVLEATLGNARLVAADLRKQKATFTVTFLMQPLTQPDDGRLAALWAYVERVDTFYVFLFKDRLDAPRREHRSGAAVERMTE